jgi:hypothetical protein
MNMHLSKSAQHRVQLSRRHFLRGLGACIALPAFESFKLPGLTAHAGTPTLATSPGGAPLRTAFLFFPNGAIPDAWEPSGTGTDFKLSPTLQPLESLQHKIQVLGGLDHRAAEGGPDGGGDHARGNGVFLTGVRSHVGRVRFWVRLCLSVQPVMEFTLDTCGGGIQPADGLRASLW